MQGNSNISTVFNSIAQHISQLGDKVLRDVATSMLPVVRDRVHVQGKASDGTQIGTYTKGYMAVRTGVYKNSDKFAKGKNKGKVKNAGTFTDATIRLNKKTGVFTGDDKVGKARPNYNRDSDTKVILSLTRQMESDFSVQVIEGGYGLGYNNQINFDKSQWAEKTYKKPIFPLTEDEKNLVIEIASTSTNKHLNGES